MSPVQMFSSPEEAFFVNSFAIGTGRSTVLVDTQFLRSSTQALITWLEEGGRGVAAVIITHPHPDHFNGIAAIRARWPDAPIHATASTIEVIAQTSEAKREHWTPIYGADYPQEIVLPEHVITPGESLAFGDVRIVLDDLGAGEAAEINVLHLPEHDTLIASDLLYNRVHPWLAEGRTSAWLAQIAEVRSRYAEVRHVFAGHGVAGNLDDLTAQADYLETFRAAVRSGVRDLSSPTPKEAAAIKADMLARYPGYPLSSLIDLNIPGVAAELARERA